MVVPVPSPIVGKKESRKVKSLSRVQLCDRVDCSTQGSSAHGIFQARVLGWVAISPPRDQAQVSHIAGRRFTI